MGRYTVTRLKLDFIHEFVDRHGKVRRYFRRRGQKRIPLPGMPGSEEFMSAYAAALALLPNHTDKTLPGTINALVVTYYASDAWNSGLTEDTRKTRRRIIEKFRADHGNKRVALCSASISKECSAPFQN
jgi:hypothetical protein